MLAKKSITLKDIARETGVHVSTVSRALTPNARASLSPEVVQKVRSAAQNMGYRPNRLASGLRTKRTMSVGVMIPDITNSLFPPIVRGVESILEAEGYASILVNTDSDPGREARLYDVLRERGVDGVVNAAVERQDPAVEKLFEEFPVVTVNRKVEGTSIPSVISDDVGGVTALVDHLRNAGHERIGHIAGPTTASTGVVRRAAFETVMRDRGSSSISDLIVHSSAYNEAEGERCADELLDRNTEITALLCANDRLAIGALESLARRGLSCPEDISVTGFNDIPFLDLIPPGLTTVQILQFEIGQTAAEILLKMMNGPTRHVPATTILPVTLIERGSVAPPARSRQRTRQQNGARRRAS